MTSGQLLDMAAAIALKTSGVPLKLGLSSASMSPVDDSICGIVHAGSRSHPHIVLACCAVTLDCAGAAAHVGSGGGAATGGAIGVGVTLGIGAGAAAGGDDGTVTSGALEAGLASSRAGWR